jgi:hypothetical protein
MEGRGAYLANIRTKFWKVKHSLNQSINWARSLEQNLGSKPYGPQKHCTQENMYSKLLLMRSERGFEEIYGNILEYMCSCEKCLLVPYVFDPRFCSKERALTAT